MKIIKLLIIALCFFSFHSEAQVKNAKSTKTVKKVEKAVTPKMGKNVRKIVEMNEPYYLTNDIGLDIFGTYNYENKGAPIVKLDPNGKGIFQLHGMPEKAMEWGIECEMDGTPKKNESPYGAVYRLWCTIKPNNGWDIVQFSIHFDEKKMYILGERIKSY